MSKAKAKRNVKFARGKVDKAQTKLIQENSKKINELMGDTEDKFNIQSGVQLAIPFPDMTSTTGRRTNIIPILIGSLQGTVDEKRIGDRVSLQTIQLRYALNLANGAIAAADEYNRIRVLMFWDNQPVAYTGGNPANRIPEWSQILQSVSPGLAQEPELACLSTYDNDQWPPRYQKVYDQVHTLASNGLTSTAIGLGTRSVTGDVKFFKKYAGRKIQYNRAGNVSMNRQLYLAFISDSTVISHPYVDYYTKVTYTDS